jgi:hypothetical protein
LHHGPEGEQLRKPRKAAVAENLSLFGQTPAPSQSTESFLPKNGLTMPKSEPPARRPAPTEGAEGGGGENDAVTRLGARINAKIGDLRKIIKSVGEMAIRMDLEQTTHYVMSEASQTGLKKMATEEVKRIVKALAAENLIQVK